MGCMALVKNHKEWSTTLFLLSSSNLHWDVFNSTYKQQNQVWSIILWRVPSFYSIMNPRCLSSRLKHKSLFADKSFGIFEGAQIWLNVYIPVHRLEKIITAFSFTNLPLPYLRTGSSKFVRWLLCNKHINYVVILSWVSCLYESIYVCTNKFTCPGWMFVSRKPYPKVY